MPVSDPSIAAAAALVDTDEFGLSEVNAVAAFDGANVVAVRRWLPKVRELRQLAGVYVPPPRPRPAELDDFHPRPRVQVTPLARSTPPR